MQDLGYDTHNFLFNLGTVAMFTFLYMMRLMFLIFLYLFSKIFPKLTKNVVELKNQLFYGEIVKIFIEAYFELLISGYLAYFANITTVDGEVISTILGYISLILTCILMPLTLIGLLL